MRREQAPTPPEPRPQMRSPQRGGRARVFCHPSGVSQFLLKPGVSLRSTTGYSLTNPPGSPILLLFAFFAFFARDLPPLGNLSIAWLRFPRHPRAHILHGHFIGGNLHTHMPRIADKHPLFIAIRFEVADAIGPRKPSACRRRAIRSALAAVRKRKPGRGQRWPTK